MITNKTKSYKQSKHQKIIGYINTHGTMDLIMFDFCLIIGLALAKSFNSPHPNCRPTI
jgi:hypothetical protein